MSASKPTTHDQLIRDRALEDAAQVAESAASEEPWYDSHISEYGEAVEIAARIRELKFSSTTHATACKESQCVAWCPHAELQPTPGTTAGDASTTEG